jgi:hypothetical protein
MQKTRKKYVKKGRKRPGLAMMLPLIPCFPDWITTGDLAKKMGITTERVNSWIAGIPENEPIAVDDLSKGYQKYCYIRDSAGTILI